MYARNARPLTVRNPEKFQNFRFPLRVDEDLALPGSDAAYVGACLLTLRGQPFGSIFKGQAVDPRPLKMG